MCLRAAETSMEELQSGLKKQGLTVFTLPEKGRCLLTTRDFYPGLSLSLISASVSYRILTLLRLHKKVKLLSPKIFCTQVELPAVYPFKIEWN